MHNDIEPYVKLGRLCVLKEERGKRWADELIQEALGWAGRNAGFMGEEWRGLVFVHAQERAVGTWRSNGFVVDEGMGEWFEAGIRHFGMLRRADLKKAGGEKGNGR